MRASKNVVFVMLVMFVGLVSGCGGGGGATSETTTPAPVPPPVVVPPTGAELYASNCATCHGAIGSTSIMVPTTLVKVKNAVTLNVGGMSIFTGTTDAKLQLIVDAINSTPQPPFDALTFFDKVCLGCHGTLGQRDFTRVQAAINLNFGNMGILRTLTIEQMRAVAAVSH